MEVVIKCKGAFECDLDSLEKIQGDLKELTPENYEKLKKQILELGFIAPFFIWENNNKFKCIDGHQRLATLTSMREEGISMPAKFPCVSIEAKNLKEAKRMVLAVSSNYGTMTTLGLEGFMKGLDMNLEECASNFTFDAVDFDIMAKEVPFEHLDPVEGEDDAPEVQPDPVAKRGDVWLLGSHRVMCGDSTMIDDVEKLMNGEKADMVFTDPPYGMFLNADYSSMESKFKGSLGGNKYDQVIGDNDDFVPELIQTVFTNFSECKEVFLWGADYYMELLPERNDGSWIIWDKRLDDSADKMFGSCFEMCWSKARHKRNIARVKWAGIFGMETQDTKKRCHPTQKPIEIIIWFFENINLSKMVSVVDLFLGSGSTLIACEKTNRKCYGMEIDERYVDVIIKRWQKFTEKEATLESTGQTYNELLEARDGKKDK